MGEVKKDVHLSEFAWILRPMDENMQTQWMSGEFVATMQASSFTQARPGQG